MILPYHINTHQKNLDFDLDQSLTIKVGTARSGNSVTRESNPGTSNIKDGSLSIET